MLIWQPCFLFGNPAAETFNDPYIEFLMLQNVGLAKKMFLSSLKGILDIIIVNSATLVPGSGNPGSCCSFLNVSIQFVIAQNIYIATITIFLESKS